MNENDSYFEKNNNFDNRLITKLDSIRDSRYNLCFNLYFHKFKYECVYDIKLTNNTNNELIHLTISDKSMNLYDVNKK